MKNIFLLFLFNFQIQVAFCQNIGINSNGTAPDGSAMLDIVATDKGLLVPRVDITDLATAAPVVIPATSLLVYNTNVGSGVGYYFWDGTKWTKLSDDNTNSDHDWYAVGGTNSPNSINESVFTLGNVGISGNSPRSFLDVADLSLDTLKSTLARLPEGNGDGKGTYLGVFSHNTQPVNVNSFSIQHRFYDSTNSAINFIRGAGKRDGEIAFATNNNTERMRIDKNGNVGIGTASPNARLEVNGGLNQTKFTGDQILFSRNNANYIRAENPSGYLVFNTNGSPSNLLSSSLALLSNNDAVFLNGNLGVNTATPTEKLEVQGSVKIVDGTQGTGKVLTSDAAGKAFWKASAVSSPIFSTSNIFPFSAPTPTSGGYYDEQIFNITIPGIYKFFYDFTSPTGYILCIDNVGYWSVLRTAGGRNFGHQAVFLSAGSHTVRLYNDAGTAGSFGPYFNYSMQGPIN